jgi:hypothetical protein
MVYKSLDYALSIFNEIKNTAGETSKQLQCNVGGRLVGNDPDDVLSDILQNNVYHDPCPKDYYLNRVYRCWNWCVKTSKYDNVCLVNSDMIFSKNWLSNLLKHHDGINIPCSRLVESGKLESKKPAKVYNFGRNINNIEKENFRKYAEIISMNKTTPNGLYMPCVFEKKRFLEAGGYPQGNVKRGSKTISGDQYLFDKLEKKYGMKHITVWDSVVYHIQEGEMDA